jgi:hypothetical protein
MKLRLRQSILFVFLFLVLPVMTYAQAQNEITESQLTAYVNSVDSASRKGNIAGVVATLANDVKIKMSIVTLNSDQEKVLTLTKQQYASNTRSVMRRRLAYSLERKNTRFEIYEGAKTATVTSDIYETLTLRQGTLRTVSSEVAIVTLRNGKLLVTSIEARTRFY